MQSVRAGAVKTHFSVFALFLKIASKRPHFGFILEAIFLQNCIVWWKKGFPKSLQKKGIPQRQSRSNKGLWTNPEAPWQPPLACAVFWTNNNLSKKQQQLLISESISESFSGKWFTFWWHFWKIVNFLMKSETRKMNHCKSCCLFSLSKGEWSDTLWAKARRIIVWFPTTKRVSSRKDSPEDSWEEPSGQQTTVSKYRRPNRAAAHGQNMKKSAFFMKQLYMTATEL